MYFLASTGQTVRQNVWRSCRHCNELRGVQTDAVDPDSGELVPLYNPRTDNWSEHFGWSDDGITLLGLSPIGRATITALQLNRPMLRSARQRWVLAGWHLPPLP